jgi:CRISPR-associated exonuclease Cas4
VHHLVDTPGYEIKSGVRVERALPVWCDRLNLIGKADLVEFHPDGTVYPVEFKHGAKRQKLHDDIQLAAQAMCLEFMTGKTVNEGAIFYASSKRRRVLHITPQLRIVVAQTAQAIRQMFATAKLPPPLVADQAAKRCKACSLLERCQPQAARTNLDAARAALFDPDA